MRALYAVRVSSRLSMCVDRDCIYTYINGIFSTIAFLYCPMYVRTYEKLPVLANTAIGETLPGIGTYEVSNNCTLRKHLSMCTYAQLTHQSWGRYIWYKTHLYLARYLHTLLPCTHLYLSFFRINRIFLRRKNYDFLPFRKIYFKVVYSWGGCMGRNYLKSRDFSTVLGLLGKEKIESSRLKRKIIGKDREPCKHAWYIGKLLHIIEKRRLCYMVNMYELY